MWQFIIRFRLLFSLFILIWPGTGLAQTPVGSFQNVIREEAGFDAGDFAALDRGGTVVKLLPVQDRREVAISGLLRLQAPAEVFLQSFRNNMDRKSNPSILEIGRFSNPPTIDDLQSLTIESRDIEDLKKCVVGDCQIKLSARMIQRFHDEVDWEAPNYAAQATQLFKSMLLDYVRDYLARGDEALIRYNDKQQEVRLADVQRGLIASSHYISDLGAEFQKRPNRLPGTDLSNVENAIVWSKMKFGLKPVIAIQQIMIYNGAQDHGRNVLIASRQIYANHYFDGWFALTAFVSNPDAGSGSYLIYENRSRVDGLDGAFGGIKRSIIENKAVDGLKAFLQQSKVNLEARAVNAAIPSPGVDERSRKRWKLGSLQLLLGVLCIAGVLALLTLRYDRKGRLNPGTAALK